jgi:serine/threonine protein kinase
MRTPCSNVETVDSQREAELLARAAHPNIVRLVATVDRAGEVNLVMEYAPGGSPLRQDSCHPA